jgi:hypothetical protein
MFLEYDWTSDLYRSRGLDEFSSIVGLRTFATLADARRELNLVGLRLVRRLDLRTWQIEQGA